MEIFLLKDGDYVMVENKEVSIFNLKEAESELKEIEKTISDIPESIPDSVFLKWGKENYPHLDFSEKLNYYNNRKAKLEKQIESAKSVKP
jgi:hypothetical protein